MVMMSFALQPPSAFGFADGMSRNGDLRVVLGMRTLPTDEGRSSRAGAAKDVAEQPAADERKGRAMDVERMARYGAEAEAREW